MNNSAAFTKFMAGAYTVASIIYVLYIISLWNRSRRVREKIRFLTAARDRSAAQHDPSPRP